jgi:maltooligosyltrehalose trehalohydrolase
LAVILDVVYNHLGPEGNVLGNFGPYVTDAYRTPWGGAINLDGPQSDAVRRYFIGNALSWLRDYHIDALRLDAIHALYDFSATAFLTELATAVRACSRHSRWPRRLIAESDRNDARVLRPPAQGGDGLDALWSEDFHHALHALLTGERQGYYADFGRLEDLAAACREGFAYAGRYSRYRRRRHGNSAADRPPEQFVVFSQNHDQVGNRRDGERLLALAGFEAAKLAAAAVCLAPAIPLLFMGEEYGEAAPFLYFVDFADPALTTAVRQGRAAEFRAFAWTEAPPDPAAAATFERSRLSWSWPQGEHSGLLRRYYQTLLALRREGPALALPEPGGLTVTAADGVLQLRRQAGGRASWLLLNLSPQSAPATVALDGWQLLLASADQQWLGPGSALAAAPAAGAQLQLPPHSCAVYGREG